MGMRAPYGNQDRGDTNERVVSLNRVAKVVKGGRKFRFSALIVVGDGNGRVGAGMGKAREVPEAIRKGVENAKRNMITVPLVGTTIPHEVHFKWGAAKILMKPAAPGTGVISGGAMRAVIELSGIKDILTKSLGTNNPINTVRATMEALKSMRTAQEIAELRGKTVEELVGRRLSVAYRTAAERGKIEAGKIEAGKIEPDKVETPKAETPKAEAPKVETPKAETPKAEAPKVETPKAETPKAEAPKAETPKAETPKAETPKAETPKSETPKSETPKAETPDAAPEETTK